MLINCQFDKRINSTIKNTEHLKTEIKEKKIQKKDNVLNENNAVKFLFDYGNKNKENKVRIHTVYGDIDIFLFENTHIHRSNFIYLIKQGYFDGTIFHRVVPNFIIQGGNSDNSKILIKRSEIGRYLLPPDTRKGNKHHRGVISMPSSEIDNPHKLASPYEFFIVQQNPGAYHLDKDYTAFGKVIRGMDVVDKINQEPTDERDTPHKNIYIKATIIR
jgi:peptidyl-prolyl cis-trans isomerase A (cyclophilin A)|tara:strand:+ start:908 stop:1558 length:651 start_codon:yes stop_codon:yes gene_type:complete